MQRDACEIVVRLATARDAEARVALVRRGLTDYDLEAFLMFFFQELTLQVCVLGGAVLFIFFGASLWACALIVPAAAVVFALAVVIAHRALADTHVQRVRKELCGFVAEYRGPLLAEPGKTRARVVPYGVATQRVEHEWDRPAHTRVVGTVSVSECWGPRHSGWLHALVVHPSWRRRGLGSSLVSACSNLASREGLESLEAVASQLQAAARGLLHTAGWELRGSYHRPVMGAALTLPMTQLGIELPHA